MKTQQGEIAGCHYGNPNAIQIIECGCCNQYHRTNYFGDCRNDNERFADPEDFEARWYGGGYPSVEVFDDASNPTRQDSTTVQTFNEKEEHEKDLEHESRQDYATWERDGDTGPEIQQGE